MPIKNKEERYEATIYMSKNKDYATGNSLEIWLIFKSLQDYCNKLKQTNLIRKPDLKQQINFIGKL